MKRIAESAGLRALSIRQPWADLIVRRIKPVENRNYPTRFRGRVLIPAAKKIDTEAVKKYRSDLGLGNPENYNPKTMAVIGMAEIVDCVTKYRSRFFVGKYGYILKNAVRFRRPIPMPGKLGFFPVSTSRLRGTTAARLRPGSFVKVKG